MLAAVGVAAGMVVRVATIVICCLIIMAKSYEKNYKPADRYGRSSQCSHKKDKTVMQKINLVIEEEFVSGAYRTAAS